MNETASRSLVVATNRPQAIIPTSIEEVGRMADIALKSGIAPRGLKTVQAIGVAILYGLELNMPPMRAIQSICVINGRPSLWGDAVPGVAYNSGQVEHIQEWSNMAEVGEPIFDQAGNCVGPDNLTYFCEAKRKGHQAKKFSFSVAQAKRAGLTTKRGPENQKTPWQTYFERMMQMRARTAIRDAFPDVLMGLQIAEVAMDIEDHQEVFNPLNQPEDMGQAQEAIQQAPGAASETGATTLAASPETAPGPAPRGRGRPRKDKGVVEGGVTATDLGPEAARNSPNSGEGVAFTSHGTEVTMPGAHPLAAPLPAEAAGPSDPTGVDQAQAEAGDDEAGQEHGEHYDGQDGYAEPEQEFMDEADEGAQIEGDEVQDDSPFEDAEPPASVLARFAEACQKCKTVPELFEMAKGWGQVQAELKAVDPETAGKFLEVYNARGTAIKTEEQKAASRGKAVNPGWSEDTEQKLQRFPQHRASALYIFAATSHEEVERRFWDTVGPKKELIPEFRERMAVQGARQDRNLQLQQGAGT